MTQIKLTNGFSLTAKVVSWSAIFDEPYHIAATCNGESMYLRFNSPTKLMRFIDYKEKAFATDLNNNKQYLVEWN